MTVTKPSNILFPLVLLKLSELVASILVAPETYRFTLPMVPLPPAVFSVPLIFTVPVFELLPMVPPVKSTVFKFAIPDASLVERIPPIVELFVTLRVFASVSNVPLLD